MAHNRCFNSFNNILSASERSKEKRQQTVYTEFKKNKEQINDANPLKTNGNRYNKNYLVNYNCDISSGYVTQVNSYVIQQDLRQGAELSYPTTVSTPKYQSWCGNLYSVDYNKYGVTNVVQNDASFNNIVIDPSSQLFYDPCLISYDATNKPEIWTKVVDLSFQATYYSRAANNQIKTC